ncbi:MAG: DegV family protein [Lachnospiraceae bacterium]|nr:DegV family protein [Lachnospiraceae bacterium]
MIKILSDSTCDLSKELVERYDIGIIPLHVYLGTQEYLDGVDIVPKKIYEWSDANGATPKTSAPAIDDVEEIYKKYIDDVEGMVVFTISSSMSASFNVCKLAAEALGIKDKVVVIDSANLSTGIGHLVIEAAELAAAGKSIGEIEKEILRLRPLVRASFIVDTLEYLHRGGRCSGLAAMFGSVLKLHPRIVVTNGAMSSDKKYRGNLESVIVTYTRELEPELVKAKTDRVFITHSGCPDEITFKVRDMLVELGCFKEVLITHAGCVVSSHCGPGTLGVLFIAQE